jgi:hypothetical protein
VGFSAITIKKKTGPVVVADKLVKKTDWTGLLSSNLTHSDILPVPISYPFHYLTHSILLPIPLSYSLQYLFYFDILPIPLSYAFRYLTCSDILPVPISYPF